MLHARHIDAPPLVQCASCGRDIAPEDPVLVVGSGRTWTTSLAREPQLGTDENVVLLHSSCVAAADADSG